MAATAVVPMSICRRETAGLVWVSSVLSMGFPSVRLRRFSRKFAMVATLKAQMWQWRSRLFDGGSEPGERVTQVLVRDFGQAGRDARRRFVVGGGGRHRQLAAERCLPQPQSAHGLPAEE